MAKGEVKNFSKDNSSIGPVPNSFGARNRIKGGASDTGSDRGGGGRGANSLSGTYSPEKIASSGGIQLQSQVKNAGNSPESGKGPFGTTIKLQRDLGNGLGEQKGDPGSMKQGPEGDFGGLPGQSGSKRSDVYRSMV